mgnify:CR=1 FL=1
MTSPGHPVADLGDQGAAAHHPGRPEGHPQVGNFRKGSGPGLAEHQDKDSAEQAAQYSGNQAHHSAPAIPEPDQQGAGHAGRAGHGAGGVPGGVWGVFCGVCGECEAAYAG